MDPCPAGRTGPYATQRSPPCNDDMMCLGLLAALRRLPAVFFESYRCMLADWLHVQRLLAATLESSQMYERISDWF